MRCWDELFIGVPHGSTVEVICPPHSYSMKNKESSNPLIQPDSILYYTIKLSKYEPGVVTMVSDKKKYFRKMQFDFSGKTAPKRPGEF